MRFNGIPHAHGKPYRTVGVIAVIHKRILSLFGNIGDESFITRWESGYILRRSETFLVMYLSSDL